MDGGVEKGKHYSVSRGALMDFTKHLVNLGFQVYPSLPVLFAWLVLTATEARVTVSCFNRARFSVRGILHSFTEETPASHLEVSTGSCCTFLPLQVMSVKLSALCSHWSALLLRMGHGGLFGEETVPRNHVPSVLHNGQAFRSRWAMC